MSSWRLSSIYGKLNDSLTYVLHEGDTVIIGRDVSCCTIHLPGKAVSRLHCIINVHSSNVTIRDVSSTNGVYVGQMKIPQNIPYCLNHSDVIGIGWATGVGCYLDLDDDNKYIFKLTKICEVPYLIN